jgi:hypothetical protein
MISKDLGRMPHGKDLVALGEVAAQELQENEDFPHTTGGTELCK